MALDGEALKWVIGQGEGLALAVLMFMLYRRDAKTHADLWEKHATQLRADHAAMLALMERQITTHVELLAALKASNKLPP